MSGHDDITRHCHATRYGAHPPLPVVRSLQQDLHVWEASFLCVHRFMIYCIFLLYSSLSLFVILGYDITCYIFILYYLVSTSIVPSMVLVVCLFATCVHSSHAFSWDAPPPIDSLRWDVVLRQRSAVRPTPGYRCRADGTWSGSVSKISLVLQSLFRRCRVSFGELKKLAVQK